MKITPIPPALIFFISIFLISCSGEEMTDLESAELKASNLEVYDLQDLEGIWDLYSMHSDVAVDFNKDKVPNKDILKETTCFNSMYYDFNANGIVTATQAKLHINTAGISSCESGVYTSPYSIQGDMLTVTFRDRNGVYVTTAKQIKLTDNNQFLHLSLKRWEASAYIKDDSGNSTAVIDSIATVYKKRVSLP